jgi:hypothetical protein
MSEGHDSKYQELFIEISNYAKSIERMDESAHSTSTVIHELKCLFVKHLYSE